VNNYLHCADVYEVSAGLTDLCKDLNYKILLTSVQRLWGYEVTNHKHLVCLTMFKAKRLKRKVYWTKNSAFFVFLYNFCLKHFYAYLASYIQDVHKNAHRSSHKGQLSLALIISTMT